MSLNTSGQNTVKFYAIQTSSPCRETQFKLTIRLNLLD